MYIRLIVNVAGSGHLPLWPSSCIRAPLRPRRGATDSAHAVHFPRPRCTGSATKIWLVEPQPASPVACKTGCERIISEPVRYYSALGLVPGKTVGIMRAINWSGRMLSDIVSIVPRTSWGTQVSAVDLAQADLWGRGVQDRDVERTPTRRLDARPLSDTRAREHAEEYNHTN